MEIELEVVEETEEIFLAVDMAMTTSTRKYSDPNLDGNIIITEVS